MSMESHALWEVDLMFSWFSLCSLFAPVLRFNAVVVQEKLACVAFALGLIRKLSKIKPPICLSPSRKLCDDIGIQTHYQIWVKRKHT